MRADDHGAGVPGHDAVAEGVADRVRAPTRLLREFLQASEDFEKVLGSELAVNATDLEAMEHLVAAGPLRATELARRLSISNAATTTVIDRLEALGHARRTVDAEDRRAVLVVPDPSSRARASGRIVRMIIDVDAVLDDFGAEEQDVVRRYLERATGALRLHLAEPDQGSAPG